MLFSARTTALTTEIAVTSTAGIAVHQISSFVCPWIGGPSWSSSSGTVKLRSAVPSTAATTAKTAMQIQVTNQKTKSIRSPSLEATWGSQGSDSATTVANAPATAPITMSWRTDRLVTAARLLD